MAVIRGEVWRVDLAPSKGTKQAGIRPCLIVQSDRANPHSPHTIIVPFTSKVRKRLLPSHVLVPSGEGGLIHDSVALCEQIRVIDNDRLMKKLGELGDARMQEINDALKIILDL